MFVEEQSPNIEMLVTSDTMEFLENYAIVEYTNGQDKVYIINHLRFRKID